MKETPNFAIIFNRDECMMHVDKNTDGYVMDQNVD